MSDQPAVPVLAAVIKRDGAYLVCRRPLHKRHGGLWEFPGGKVEPGEGLLEAARRELHEELGVEVVRIGRSLFSRRDPGSRFVIEFCVVEIEGEPRCVEHSELRWLDPDELGLISLAPTDAAFVQWLKDEAGSVEDDVVDHPHGRLPLAD